LVYQYTLNSIIYINPSYTQGIGAFVIAL